ncbi:pentapeptide repeat-containing protein [Streptomyces canus]|uniref:pentapeptide repeat-containing protein n=1 Tax=Streptomyces canus TaxID=58343 RepID=UPI0022567794|nr:pentapeptide repeat-containing protein [Streptomyces canus]MCX5255148.1 pentapeptide repeat-containing protein [Streptomyces canus]
MAAVAALLFTGLAVQQNTAELKNRSRELDIEQQNQVTGRFTTAVELLGNEATDARLGGIYALQRIMTDSPRDRPAIVQILSSYIRTNATKPQKSKAPSLTTAALVPQALPDVAAAASVLAAYDGPQNSLDWNRARLDAISLPNAHLSGAQLRHTTFANADLNNADLRDAQLTDADLNSATLRGANLRDASLAGADFSYADLAQADLRGAFVNGTNFDGADLTGADLRGVDLGGANLDGANLQDARR